MDDWNHIIDNDGCEWVKNPDGSWRCLNAEVWSMQINEIENEFGPIRKILG